MAEKRRKMRNKLIYAFLVLLIPVSVALYIYSRTYAKAERLGLTLSPAAFDSIMSRALPALIAMFAAAVLIAVVSLAFQTITQSRILTPSMIGFDSVFVGTQTLIVFLFGANSVIFANPYLNYFVTAAAMVVISLFMYGFILRKNKNNMIFLLMFGLVLSSVIGSGTRYLQVIMSTEDYYRVQAATSVTINNMNTGIILIAVPIIFVICVLIFLRHRKYNVMSLGEYQAKGLGIQYEREMFVNLFFISVGMSVATALIGSLTFLGLLAVNASRELLKTHKHLPLFIVSSLLSALTLIFGQGLVEMLQGAVPVTAIINLTGCSYMFYLIIKENRI